MEKISILKWLGVPEAVGITLFVVAIALILAKWLPGQVVGALRLPQAEKPGRFLTAGLALLVLTVFLHWPLFPSIPSAEPSRSAAAPTTGPSPPPPPPPPESRVPDVEPPSNNGEARYRLKPGGRLQNHEGKLEAELLRILPSGDCEFAIEHPGSLRETIRAAPGEKFLNYGTDGRRFELRLEKADPATGEADLLLLIGAP